MKIYCASLKNEWTKLMSKKKYPVFIIIGVVICILWAILGQMIFELTGTHVGLAINLAPTPMGMLPLFLQIIVPLLIFMGVTDLITVEGFDNTMRAMLTRPVERWKLYFSKINAVVIYAALYLAIIFVACLILSFVFGRSLGIIEILTALASYALTIVPLTILASFAALIALFGKSGTLTMFILLFAYLILNVAPIVLPINNEILFTSYLSWHRLWIGILPEASSLIHMLVIVLGYGFVFLISGSLIFERKEY